MKLKVEPWHKPGAVGLEIEQLSPWGDWFSVLDTDEVGTYPNYVTSATITAFGTSTTFRYRWETGVGQFTNWLTPQVLPTLSAEATERVTQAVIQKSTRVLKLAEAPLGHWGDLTEFGMATVRRDYEIEELLHGLRFRNWDVDLTTLVETDDVIRQGLQIDPDDFPAERLPDVQRAIDTAISWVSTHLLEGIGVA